MTILATPFDLALTAARDASCSPHLHIEAVKVLDDASLMAAQTTLAEIRRAIDACSSLVAGEIGHRSRRDLGYAGLAQRQGFRTAEALVQHQTGSTAREAATLVTIGKLVRDSLTEADSPASAHEASEFWFAAVGKAVNAGAISVAAAAAIRSGLGDPTAETAGAGVRGADLVTAVDTLLSEAPNLNADRLFTRARQLRDDLDAALITERERAIHEQRSIRRVRHNNGLHRYIINPDIESAAFWDDVYDKLTAPRRGGARFIDLDDAKWADAIATDPRTTEQYVHDALTDLLRLATNSNAANNRRIIGSRIPAVRVLVTAKALDNRTGHGRIEGCDIPISIETVERIICTAGTIEVRFDPAGQIMDLGREQRCFTPAQRIALAVRDGGCRWIDCDRTASQTEAHHVQHWKRDNGKTNIADGLQLCRHHHMLLHNNHWEIQRTGAEYWLTPPPNTTPHQTRRLMPTKSASLHDLLREQAAGEYGRTSVDTETIPRPGYRRVAPSHTETSNQLAVEAADAGQKAAP